MSSSLAARNLGRLRAVCNSFTIAAPQRRTCGIAAQIYSPEQEIIEIAEAEAYLPGYVAMHKNGVTQMVALIEKFLDAMFAPLARELERLPASAMRFNVFF